MVRFSRKCTASHWSRRWRTDRSCSHHHPRPCVLQPSQSLEYGCTDSANIVGPGALSLDFPITVPRLEHIDLPCDGTKLVSCWWEHPPPALGVQRTGAMAVPKPSPVQVDHGGRSPVASTHRCHRSSSKQRQDCHCSLPHPFQLIRLQVRAHPLIPQG